MTMLDHFAERLSQHGNVAKAASQLGKSAAWGEAQLRALRKALGAQAC